MISDAGVPIELIETTLSDDEIWPRARSGHGSLYRSQENSGLDEIMVPGASR